MLFELIAVIVAGVAAGGVVMIVRRIIPALPRWLVPVVAGAAMLAVSISLEYSWFARNSAALPEGVKVATVHENKAFWRPWTYAFPYVDRFIAVSQTGALENEAAEGQKMTSLYIFGRWTPTRRIRAVFDCESGRRADLLPGLVLGEDGSVPDSAWIDTGRDDPVTRTACAEA
ncbi:hypothetical protein [Roseovarius sp. M141]|uniref:hypothetical protein n=1 Tax=Roseovarius sp. M141 TaxID=2583806 RepID=UPI0020CE1BF5|nr:hypothetical protein [Roseovarius sp. M141]MCQ0090568.1 hypothetical protein [Roseovarius sp. M141]